MNVDKNKTIFNINLEEYIKSKNLDLSWLNITTDSEGQKKLEKEKISSQAIFNSGLFKFSANITRNLQNIENLEIIKLKIIDDRYFKRDYLFTLISVVVSLLKFTFRNRITVINIIKNTATILLDKYLQTKKIKAITWSKLSDKQKEEIFYQITCFIIQNLKDLQILQHHDNYLTLYKLNPSFNTDLVDDTFFYKFSAYPCIYTPQPWKNKTTGGYYLENSSEFIRQDETFVGSVEPNQILFEIINELQKKEWTLDIPEQFIKEEFKILLDRIKILKEQEFLKISENDLKKDLFQELNTYMYLKSFFPKFKKIYYPYNIDFRGRVYPLCSWGYSPTSSKKIREYLSLYQEKILTEEGKNWLIIKLGLLLNLKQKASYNKIFNETKDRLLQNNDLLNLVKENLSSYQTYKCTNIIKSIKSQKTSMLIKADATTSSLQFIGMATNSEKLMRLTNLIGPMSEDFSPTSNYIFNDVYSKLILDLEPKLPHPIYKVFLDRKLIKKLIMPLAYGKKQISSLEDLLQFLKADENRLDIANSLEDMEIYNLLDSEKARTNWTLSFNTTEDKLQKGNRKRYYFSLIFYNFLMNEIEKEYPEIFEFLSIFQNKQPFYCGMPFFFESEYLSYNLKYLQQNVTRISWTTPTKKKKDTNDKQPYKTTRISFRTILKDKEDLKKDKNSAAANYIHSCDAYVIHYLLDKYRDIQLYPIHDCILVHPNDLTRVMKGINEAYCQIQLKFKNNPAFSKFFTNKELIPITSKNIFKIDD